MIRVSLEGVDVVQRELLRAGSQIPFATALALTRTGAKVKTAIVKSMRTVFDRPTPYTLRSLYLVPARKEHPIPQATVWFKDEAGKGTAAERYLLPQVYGGGRLDKRSETLLRQAGYLPPGMQAVPASGAPIDRYGNLKRGYIQRVLSNLRAQFDPRSNVSGSRRSRRGAATAKVFVSRGGHLPRGIWERFGRRVIPVLLFTSPHRYRRRLDFFGIGERVIANELLPQARAAVSQALRTAR